MELPLTIEETRRGLKEKKFSAVEVVDEYLRRIEKSKDLNAFISTTSEAAYEAAKKYDEALPLSGVAVVHKDLFLTKGVRTTAGSKVLNDYIPAYSATVVERLRNAGTVMIGKTNCDAWAHGASGENSDFGPTKNPWNRNHVPGGSSSGSAAAAAAGLTLVATGTDTGGSIRQPANFCGVTGLKPTYGAISRYGIVAMASSLDSPGVFGQTVADVETVFNLIKGPDGLDSTVVEGKSETKKSNLRIGIPKEYFPEGLDKEVEKSVIAASQVFKKEGVEIVDIDLPHTKHAIDVYYIVQPAEVSSNLGRYDGIRYGNGRTDFGEEAIRRIMLGTYVLSAGYYDAYYLQAQKVRSKIIEDFEKAFTKVDAIIAPVSPTPAFKIGEKVNDPLKMYLADILTAPANLAGIPGISIPSGFTKNNLPLGFQLLGPRFSEPQLFELGKIYQKAVDYKPSLPKEL